MRKKALTTLKNTICDDRTVIKCCNDQEVRYGTGSAPCHHGEILQGVFEEENGVNTQALVTLPMDRIGSSVMFSVDPGARETGVIPRHKKKALSAAVSTLKFLGASNIHGNLHIDTFVNEGSGLGSSTSDVVATCYAVANALGQYITPELVARISVMAERASDSTMHVGNTVLFAQQEGRIIETLGPEIPKLSILSFSLGPPIATCTNRVPEYTREDLQMFKRLLGMLRRGLECSDVKIIARVGLLSAKINQRFIEKPFFDEVVSIVETNYLAGLQIAHSGNRVGLIFCPDDRDVVERVIDTKKRLASLGIGNVRYMDIGH